MDLILPSLDHSKFAQILKSKYSQTIEQRFDDMPHGWVGGWFRRWFSAFIIWLTEFLVQATANFSNPLEKQKADEVINLGAGFFNKVL